MRKHFSNKTRQHTKGEKMVWSQMKPEDLQRKSKGLNKEILKKVLLFFFNTHKIHIDYNVLSNWRKFRRLHSRNVTWSILLWIFYPNQNKILSLWDGRRAHLQEKRLGKWHVKALKIWRQQLKMNLLRLWKGKKYPILINNKQLMGRFLLSPHWY